MEEVKTLQYIDAIERTLLYFAKNGKPEFTNINGKKCKLEDVLDAVKRSQAFEQKNKSLPGFVNMNLYSDTPAPSPAPIQSIITFNEVIDGANQIRTYIEKYKQIPGTVPVSGKKYDMATFLYIMAATVKGLKDGKKEDITYHQFPIPTHIVDNTRKGNIPQTEFYKIATDIQHHMDISGKTPDYAYNTSLGMYMGFNNLIYMYSMILNYYGTSGKVADYAVMTLFSAAKGPKVTALENQHGVNLNNLTDLFELIRNKGTWDDIPCRHTQFKNWVKTLTCACADYSFYAIQIALEMNQYQGKDYNIYSMHVYCGAGDGSYPHRLGHYFDMVKGGEFRDWTKYDLAMVANNPNRQLGEDMCSRGWQDQHDSEICINEDYIVD